MHKWSDAPIVTFSRNGQDIVLGRSGDSPVLHLHGSTGLGLAPVEVSKSSRLAGDGSIVRGVRYADREVFIPLFVEQPSTGDLSLWRRELNRLLAPASGDPGGSLVDVRVEDPATGTVRIARGIYTGGLEGDFGSDFYGNWQTLGVTFECPDPWWLGPERTQTLQVDPGSKPFLSDSVPFFPIILGSSTVVGEFDVPIEGDGEVWPVWEITGPGTDLLIQRGDERIFIAGEFPAGDVTRIQTRPRRITPDRWDDVSLDSTLFSLQPGQNRIHITMVGATPETLVRLVWQERYLEGI